MITKTLNQPVKLNHKKPKKDLKITVINSLSPNFSYINKSGDMVFPEKCYVY